MAAEYEGQDPLDIAKQAEQDLNSAANKSGNRGNTTGFGGKTNPGGSFSSKLPPPSSFPALVEMLTLPSQQMNQESTLQ